ncbi:hypothetical protein HY025_06255 [Candidatus Daviesbacteria bacterium]|nr:hypothetical protein [Candidatus Daviesbacteria bacterium]
MDSKLKRGRGWFGDSRRHAEAGRKGGQSTASGRGQAFYSEIGRKGGRSRSQRASKKSSMMLDDSEI